MIQEPLSQFEDKRARILGITYARQSRRVDTCCYVWLRLLPENGTRNLTTYESRIAQHRSTARLI